MAKGQFKWKNKSGTKTYIAWRNMKRRCCDQKDPAYHRYGGRGITICDKWINDYDAFFDDMGECPDGLTLDRVDNEGNYEPGNCRWVSMKVQQRNKSSNRLIFSEGKTMAMSGWAEKLGIKTGTLAKRLERMSSNEAVKLVRPRWRHGTRAGYEYHGCRCNECKASNTARHKARRARYESA